MNSDVLKKGPIFFVHHHTPSVSYPTIHHLHPQSMSITFTVTRVFLFLSLAYSSSASSAPLFIFSSGELVFPQERLVEPHLPSFSFANYQLDVKSNSFTLTDSPFPLLFFLISHTFFTILFL